MTFTRAIWIIALFGVLTVAMLQAHDMKRCEREHSAATCLMVIR